MSENIPTSSEIPDLDLELYATMENTWWHILQYYRNIERTLQTQKKDRYIEEPNIPEFCEKMNQLVALRDYTLIVAIWHLQALYKEGVLSREDIEKSPLHSFFMKVMNSTVQVGLIRYRTQKIL